LRHKARLFHELYSGRYDVALTPAAASWRALPENSAGVWRCPALMATWPTPRRWLPCSRCGRSGSLTSSAKPDDPDRAESMADDLLAGLSFLRELEPTHIFLGNHEHRLVSLAHSGNAVVSYAAGNVLARISDAAKEMRAKVIPYDGLRPSACVQLGDTLFLHGVMYNVSAARDHAEALGMSCVHGHTHRVAQEQGRTQRPVVGYNVGCGIKLDVGYAQTRRQTLGWAHGLCWFEYSDNLTIVRLETLSPHYRLPL
jgi:hypothetical protein